MARDQLRACLRRARVATWTVGRRARVKQTKLQTRLREEAGWKWVELTGTVGWEKKSAVINQR